MAAAARNISLDEIRNAVSRANSNVPVGTLAGEQQNITLQASGALTKAADYQTITVAYRNGVSVKLNESPACSTASRTTRSRAG